MTIPDAAPGPAPRPYSAGMGDIEIRLMRSVMSVGDMDAAIAFWSSLGLEKQWRAKGETTAIGMGANCIQIMLLEADQPDGIAPQCIYITVEGVDAMHARCMEAQPEQTGPVGDRDYGMRDFSVIDQWWHMVIFGEPIQRSQS